MACPALENKTEEELEKLLNQYGSHKALAEAFGCSVTDVKNLFEQLEPPSDPFSRPSM